MASKEEVQSFSAQIEKLANQKSSTIMEAVVLYCDLTGFEIELAAKLLTETLKARLRNEAEDLHYIKRPSVSTTEIITIPNPKRPKRNKRITKAVKHRKRIKRSSRKLPKKLDGRKKKKVLLK